ncbi:two pore domain potassium channel family protein [Candidatus Woesearchaeota archaeon]|nr:two pore domain potassium channel family protein [Candidatus Woesearchaeota archaeon]
MKRKIQNQIEFKDMFKRINNRNLIRWMDNLTFFKILIILTIVIIIFGVTYIIFSNNSSFLLNNQEGKHVSGIKDSIYFSFVAATTTGFGDIIPMGMFKFIAIIEVIFGLLLIAFVTSKLVSIKQDVILSEVYELSFNEKINRIRSSLLLFRQNIDRIMGKIEENSIKKREINNIHIHISSLEDVISDLIHIIVKQKRDKSSTYFIKSIDSVNTELILNSIITSFEKLYDLIFLMAQNKTEWKTDINILILNKCLNMNETLFNQLISSNIIIKEKLNDIISQKNKIVSLIKSEIEQKQN